MSSARDHANSDASEHDLPRRISDRLSEAWPDLRDDPVYLDQLGEEAAKVVQPGDFRDFCGASAIGVFRQVLGPCILRHGHDGPVHEDAQRQQWTHSIIPTGEHDDLRDQIMQLMRTYHEPVSGARGRETAGVLTDAVMAVVQPALDAKDARIAELEARIERFKKQRAGWSGISDLRAEANEYEAERDRLKAAIDRVRELAAAALATWEPEHAYRQERAERKGYAHDETAAEIYGLAVEAVTAILAALDRPEES